MPAVPGGVSSVTAAENCAESATTVTPQITATSVVRSGSAQKLCAVTTAALPLIAIAMMVSVVRPARSASSPAPMQPTPPTATTTKATRLAMAASSTPAAAKLASRNTGIHVHMA
ncbi:MAG: hypothetical protein R6W93_15375 [Candidatus Limnocylindrales bacterium]